MSFDTRNGTRGGKRPGPFMRWMSSMAVHRMRRTQAIKVMGSNTLILTTIGKRTGEHRSTPVGWYPYGNGRRLILASANGSRENPAWYYNLAAHPDQVVVEIGGQRMPVVAEQLHGENRSLAWEQLVAADPRLKGFEKKTDREIPIILLTPRD